MIEIFKYLQQFMHLPPWIHTSTSVASILSSIKGTLGPRHFVCKLGLSKSASSKPGIITQHSESQLRKAKKTCSPNYEKRKKHVPSMLYKFKLYLMLPTFANRYWLKTLYISKFELRVTNWCKHIYQNNEPLHFASCRSFVFAI